LQTCNVRLHLVSRVHPSLFPLPSSAAGSAGPDTIERWSRLVGFFEQIHLDPDLSARAGGSEADHPAIWLVCSPEERLGLNHIAKNGFISPRFPELPCLFQRGLVFRQSQLSLASPGFARFVRESFPPEISRLRAIEEKDSIWNIVKGPVKTVLFI